MKYNFLILFLILFSGCDDNYVSSIPDFPVYLQLNLTTTYPTFKNSSNQYLLFEKKPNDLVNRALGFGGILVYTGISLDDSGNTIYYAFDMSCPYEADTEVKVFPNEDDLGKVICEKCGSVYDISYGFGNPVSGPSTEILKSYRTNFSNDVLVITRK